MPLPWISIIDGVLGATDIVRWVKGGRSPAAVEPSRGSSRLEARLAGVVVSAMKEAFSRDQERADFERRRLEEERERQERLLRFEFLRQAGEREIGRLRTLTFVALATLLGTFFVAARLTGGGGFGRVMLGLGWSMLIGALAAALDGQRAIARALNRADDRAPVSEVSTSAAGAAAPWMIVTGAGLIAIGVLFT